ncbi:polysaccharide pyruvyl transferase family protein [Jannaschia donghaensis]|uniref:Exopolysaccharide glucosyl ketal-pyruvate-transferase n=1 Tax=Jannaschia donghaensis TaxID=420998 RepID=A0A0M6YIN9_9RHOB|nr:polysaccharide pyruvyl transferase family protein [Jannaschia donghaensis]CTQ49794.1 Exopolysaccharide glucosyl ketal-pyruvate-transferase [Jannaschia donghaensis]
MRPFYYSVTTNFGDHMNAWMWRDLCPALVQGNSPRLVGVGSLLSHNLDDVPGDKVVFGTGTGYSGLPTPEQAARWKIYCVRGPLTARHLGLDPAVAITDGAWLVDRLPEYANLTRARRGTVFVPHWTSSQYGNWAAQCAQMDVDFVDPFWDGKRVLSAIANADLAIVESLHGAIMADYYRTPWIAVSSPARVLKFKWLDWCGSLDLSYRPFELPASDIFDARLQGRAMGANGGVPVPIDVAPDTFDVAQSAPTRAKPGPLNAARVQAKSVLRTTRAAGFRAMAALRGSGVARRANRANADEIAAYFEGLQRQTPMLSSDAVRADRLARLSDAFERMLDDYNLR